MSLYDMLKTKIWDHNPLFPPPSDPMVRLAMDVPGGRVTGAPHYYRDMFSLCRRVGFYNGPLEPDDAPSKDDCKACRKALESAK